MCLEKDCAVAITACNLTVTLRKVWDWKISRLLWPTISSYFCACDCIYRELKKLLIQILDKSFNGI